MRDLIIALFRRIGEQPDFKDIWEKLPNAERSAMAGDFYNIITSHSSIQSKRDQVLDAVFAPMDTFFGNIPMDEHIIKWAVSKQDSFVTAAMATYLTSRELRQSKEDERGNPAGIFSCVGCYSLTRNECEKEDYEACKENDSRCCKKCKQDERDKVLDDIELFRKTNSKEYTIYALWVMEAQYLQTGRRQVNHDAT